jgi:hypothetical protein
LEINDTSSADSTGLIIANGYTTDAANDASEIMFRLYRSYTPSLNDAAFVKAVKEQAWDSSGDRDASLTFGTRSGGTEPTERMRIDSSGNVGIGLTPAEKLEVFGNIKVNAANDKGFLLGGNSAILRQNSTEMGFETNGSERMRLNATGLGIGTTSPDTLLEAEGTSSLPLFLSRQQSSAGVGVGLGFVGLGFRQYDSTNALHNYASIFGVIEDNTNGAEDGAVTIHTSLAGSLGERMRITSDGYLFLNHTNSWQSLGTFVIKQKADDRGLGVVDDAGQNAFQFINNGSSAGIKYNVDNPITFSQNSGERMRISVRQADN